MPKQKMTEEEFEEFLDKKLKEIVRTPNNPKRRQPHQKRWSGSWRQEVALRQESNPVKAMYELDKVPTPIRYEEGPPLTREVGPGQDLNPMWALQKHVPGGSGNC